MEGEGWGVCCCLEAGRGGSMYFKGDGLAAQCTTCGGREGGRSASAERGRLQRPGVSRGAWGLLEYRGVTSFSKKQKNAINS